mmetsp:Transcript_15105/g.41512  ORF Transcript_15105/g.41512 Transcript_15105/m.41512 type:complete len:90 (+) Transcript_15105:48-317(+)
MGLSAVLFMIFLWRGATDCAMKDQSLLQINAGGLTDPTTAPAAAPVEDSTSPPTVAVPDPTLPPTLSPPEFDMPPDANETTTPSPPAGG